MTDAIVLVTGGFDPLHSGHIEYFREASKLGRLVVGINSDEWLTRKKGRPFMPLEERRKIINSLTMVMTTVVYDDSDGSSKDAIRKVRELFPLNRIIFANGGDRTKENIPEMDIDIKNVFFAFGVGGEDKKNSSSWILQDWKEPKTERPWGFYRVLYDTTKTKVKELVVEPGKSLSMQRHEKRSEYWHVAEGTATITITNNNSARKSELEELQSMFIPVGTWHRLSNETDKPLKLIEIQYGENCYEEDIERR